MSDETINVGEVRCPACLRPYTSAEDALGDALASLAAAEEREQRMRTGLRTAVELLEEYGHTPDVEDQGIGCAVLDDMPCNCGAGEDIEPLRALLSAIGDEGGDDG